MSFQTCMSGMSFGRLFLTSFNPFRGSLRGEKSVTTAPKPRSDTKPGRTSPAAPCSKWNWIFKCSHSCLVGQVEQYYKRNIDLFFFFFILSFCIFWGKKQHLSSTKMQQTFQQHSYRYLRGVYRGHCQHVIGLIYETFCSANEDFVFFPGYWQYFII